MALRIKEAREAVPYTQQEFATELGVSWRAVQKWESGENEPRPSSIRAMAAVTGRSAAYFLGIEEAVA